MFNQTRVELGWLEDYYIDENLGKMLTRRKETQRDLFTIAHAPK